MTPEKLLLATNYGHGLMYIWPFNRTTFYKNIIQLIITMDVLLYPTEFFDHLLSVSDM